MSNKDSTGPIVVGIDGSDAAVEAARWAVKEAVHHDVPLRLVYVIQSGEPQGASGHHRPVDDGDPANSLRAACAAVAATGLQVHVDTDVLCDDVELALIAESGKASLLCVGSTGVGRVARAVVGSTAATLAEYARCPVAIVRSIQDRPVPDVGFIAVAVDNSPGNEEVVRWAMDEARARRAPVLAVGARQRMFRTAGDPFFDRVDQLLRRYPDVHIEIARTHMGFARYLEGCIGSVQLAVIGDADTGRLAQLLGPHGVPVLTHADCSVLVVRTSPR